MEHKGFGCSVVQTDICSCWQRHHKRSADLQIHEHKKDRHLRIFFTTKKAMLNFNFVKVNLKNVILFKFYIIEDDLYTVCMCV